MLCCRNQGLLAAAVTGRGGSVPRAFPESPAGTVAPLIGCAVNRFNIAAYALHDYIARDTMRCAVVLLALLALAAWHADASVDKTITNKVWQGTSHLSMCTSFCRRALMCNVS